MTNETPQTKKAPYTGDPNATLTICSKKRRRHLSRDLNYVVTKSEIDPETNPKGFTVFIVCRHCKENPFIDREELDEAGSGLNAEGGI